MGGRAQTSPRWAREDCGDRSRMRLEMRLARSPFPGASEGSGWSQWHGGRPAGPPPGSAPHGVQEPARPSRTRTIQVRTPDGELHVMVDGGYVDLDKEVVRGRRRGRGPQRRGGAGARRPGSRRVRERHVVGCDGANSTVRCTASREHARIFWRALTFGDAQRGGHERHRDREFRGPQTLPTPCCRNPPS